MEQFQGINNENYTNDEDSHIQSYPYFQIQAFQKQNPTKTLNDASQSVFNQHVFPSHDLTSQYLFGKPLPIDFDREKEMMSHSLKHHPRLVNNFSFMDQGILPSYHQEDYIQNTEQSHQRSEINGSTEFAPQFRTKPQNRPLNFGPSNKTYNINHEYLLSNQHIQCFESNNRVNISPFHDKTGQFTTPMKKLDSHNHQSKIYSLTEVKSFGSQKKASRENLEEIKRQILPIHQFSLNSSKTKILDLPSAQKGKNQQNSGKGSRVPKIKNQKLFDEKNTAENNNNQKQQMHQMVNSSGNIGSTIYDSNRRMNKIKTKKKILNKTQPISHQEDQVMASNDNSFRTSLSFETYHIKHLNSLKEFNQRLEQQRRQSLSLLRNLENSLENLSNQKDDFNNYNQHPNSFHEENNMSSFSSNPLIQTPKLQNQFSFSINYHSNTDGKKNPNNQNIISSKNVTFQEELSLQKPEIQPFKQVQDLTRVKCNCQKNNCRKGYCDCLKNNLACDPSRCQCSNCENDVLNHDSLRKHIEGKQYKQLSSSLLATQSAIGALGKSEIGVENTRGEFLGVWNSGCKCKNSFCKKNYCECHQNNRLCDPNRCKCFQCQNQDPNQIQQKQKENPSIQQK